MNVYDCSQRTDDFYKKIYDYNYWLPCNPMGVRLGDQWEAMCYCHGIFDPPWVYSISSQTQYLKSNLTRRPRKILEIGSGFGEVSVSLAHMEYDVISVDCNLSAAHFHKGTARRLFGAHSGSNHDLYIGDLNAVGDCMHIQDVDTVIMVESIEHIRPLEWQQFYQKLLPILKNNSGYLVITNYPKNYWPLGGPGDSFEHIQVVDDVFYDGLVKDSARVLYRDRSHICLTY